MKFEFEQIAHMECGYREKFGIPRQAGLADAVIGRIVFEEKYRNADALRGLEGFSHIWVIWLFSENEGGGFSPTVRPPRLGGNRRMGVFATRSPNRPNPVGLSCVKIEAIEGTDIVVSGADLMDGTPILDIKPYIPYADMKPEAAEGFAAKPEDHLNVKFECICPEEIKKALEQTLSLDPRPRYQSDPERVYGLNYEKYNIKFTVDGDELTVKEISEPD